MLTLPEKPHFKFDNLSRELFMFLFLLPEASPSSLTELHQKAQKSGKRVAERATRMQIEMALNSLISHQVILQTNDK